MDRPGRQGAGALERVSSGASDQQHERRVAIQATGIKAARRPRRQRAPPL
jgi:hypothetical protein